MTKIFYIGSGPISRFHIPALKNAGFEVSGLATRPGSDRSFEICSNFGIDDRYVNCGWKESLEKCDTYTGVVVAVDTRYTPEILEYCLSLNVPVLVEKPGAWHHETLEELIRKHPESSKKVMVAYNRRYYETVARFKSFIKANSGLIRMSVPDSIGSVRQFLVNGCHMIDLLRYVLGDVELEANKLHWSGDKITGFSSLGKSACNRWDIILEGNWEASSNFEISAFTKGKTCTLKPIEVFREYRGMDIVEPDDMIPIRRYIPCEIEKLVVASDFKPGFYEQYLDFQSFIKNGTFGSSGCSLMEAAKSLRLCHEILGDRYTEKEVADL